MVKIEIPSECDTCIAFGICDEQVTQSGKSCIKFYKQLRELIIRKTEENEKHS